MVDIDATRGSMKGRREEEAEAKAVEVDALEDDDEDDNVAATELTEEDMAVFPASMGKGSD